MATDAKYCYISTTTSQSSSSSNYQNIPYRMETTTPVVYQGSSIAPLNYMPIAIWSTLPVFKTSVYYNNGTSTVTYPTSDSSLLNMNQNTGPAMFGNGAGKSSTSFGSKATPFFGRYQEHYGEIRDNWQVYTGYVGGTSTSYHYPPAAPIYAAATYKEANSTYTGYVTVTVYNYAEYSVFVCLCLLIHYALLLLKLGKSLFWMSNGLFGSRSFCLCFISIFVVSHSNSYFIF